METQIIFALTASEMGLNPLLIVIIISASFVFLAGFIKSSRENEYKKLMDYYTQNQEKSD